MQPPLPLHRDRLNVDLCVALAGAVKDSAAFVLVGPVALDAQDQDRLKTAGALLLGSRDHTTIPAYLKSADVLVALDRARSSDARIDALRAPGRRAARRQWPKDRR